MGRLAFLQEWSSHAVFGDTFRSTLDKIIEEFGEAPSAQEVKQEESEAGNPKKRKGRGETQATVAKCTRSAVPVKQIPIQSIGSEQVLLETELVNCKNKGLKLQMKAGGKVYVLNMSSTAAKLPAGWFWQDLAKALTSRELLGSLWERRRFSSPFSLRPWF